MSRATLNAFLARVSEDANLQEKLRSVTEGDGDSLRASELVRFGKEHGYEFTMEDVHGADSELKDAELEGVTGGFGTFVGVEGEAQDDKHKGWTDILSFDSLISFRNP